MNTNLGSPLNTRKIQNASQTSAIVLTSLLAICDFDQGRIGWPPSARRFVTLRASENNVMRKLEVHSPSVTVALRLLGSFQVLCIGRTA